MTDVQTRLARLEGEVSSFRVLFAAIIAILLGGFGFLGVQVTRTDNRISAVAADVQGIPGKIHDDLLNLTRTLADSINAAKQTPPQVLLMPVPGPQPAPPRP
jgi:hypothetical protein